MNRSLVGLPLLFAFCGAAACGSSNDTTDQPFPNADASVDDAADAANESDADTNVDSGTEITDGSTGKPDGEAVVTADTVWGIIGTGQSLSIGAYATPVFNTSTRYSNLKLGFTTDDGVWRSSGTLVYLGEQIRPSSTYAYPYNIAGESPHTSMADQITSLSMARTGTGDVTLHTVVGKDGWGMAEIGKNGVVKPATPTDPAGNGYSYQAALDEVTEVVGLVKAKGLKYRVGAILLTHGETDYGDFNYDQKMVALLNDYNSALKTITGDTTDIPMIASQSSPGYPTGVNTLPDSPTSAVRQWAASVDHPTSIFLSGPKYQFDFAADHVHLTTASTQRLGIKYGQVYDAIRSGAGWKPLRPSKIVTSGNTITIDFDVPTAPIAFDESIDVGHASVHTPWKNGRGFEVLDGTTEIEVSSVVLSGPKQITITCSTAPSATAEIRYATANDGPGNHRKGQVVDSDPFIGIDKVSLSTQVTNGSPIVTVQGALNHGPRDLAVSASLPSGTIIKSVNGDQVTLSNAWTGASGTATIDFRTDQRNYLVQFVTGVSYP